MKLKAFARIFFFYQKDSNDSHIYYKLINFACYFVVKLFFVRETKKLQMTFELFEI